MMETLKVSNVTLSELKGGAVEEHFQRALDMVLRNVDDVNTDPKAARTITVKLTFRPTDDRTMVMLDANVTPKLASAAPVQTALILKHDGKGKLMGNEPIQDDLPYQVQ